MKFVINFYFSQLVNVYIYPWIIGVTHLFVQCDTKSVRMFNFNKVVDVLEAGFFLHVKRNYYTSL